MTLYLVLGGFIAAAIAFILIGRAARPAPKGEDEARSTFASLPDFDPGEVHARDGAAISYDPVRNIVTIWDKAGGARPVDPGGVAGWRAEPEVELYARTICGRERAAWRHRLQAAFGADKDRGPEAAA